MAPEVAAQDGQLYSFEADMFSVGLVLYMMSVFNPCFVQYMSLKSTDEGSRANMHMC